MFEVVHRHENLAPESGVEFTAPVSGAGFYWACVRDFSYQHLPTEIEAVSLTRTLHCYRTMWPLSLFTTGIMDSHGVSSEKFVCCSWRLWNALNSMPPTYSVLLSVAVAKLHVVLCVIQRALVIWNSLPQIVLATRKSALLLKAVLPTSVCLSVRSSVCLSQW